MINFTIIIIIICYHHCLHHLHHHHHHLLLLLLLLLLHPPPFFVFIDRGPGEGKRARSKSRGQKCSTSENVETVQRIADLKDTDNK